MRILLSLIFIFFIYVFYEGLKKNPNEIPSNLISKKIPDFKMSGFKSSEMTNYDLSNNEIKIVNFFASWCPPCQLEHQQLEYLGEKNLVYGIAKKNKLEDLKPWLEKFGNPFKKIGMDFDGAVSIDWGVYGLPETFLVDSDGIIKYKHVGPIMKKDLKKIERIINNIK